MDLTIVIPCYNESHNITILLDQLFQCFSEHSIVGEVIVVDDDSPDRIWQQVELYHVGSKRWVFNTSSVELRNT